VKMTIEKDCKSFKISSGTSPETREPKNPPKTMKVPIAFTPKPPV